MAEHNNKSVSSEMNEMVWGKFPALVSKKISHSLGNIFADGAYLKTILPFAFILPFICFVTGILFGGAHVTFTSFEVFSFSLTAMILMAIPSAFSTCLGLWICIGYGFGDIFIYKYAAFLRDDATFGFIIKGLLARLIAVFFLYLLLVLIPMAGKNLSKRMTLRLDLTHPNRKIIQVVLAGLFTAFIVYGWTRAVPLMIKPVYSWQSLTMPGVLPPLYANGWKLCLILGLGVMIKTWVQYETRIKPSAVFIQTSVVTNPIQLAKSNNNKGRFIILLLLTTVFSTFVTSALYSSWTDAFIFASAVLLATVIKNILVPSSRQWINVMNKIPLLVRFISGILICWLFYKFVAGPFALKKSGGEDQVFIAAVLRSILYTMIVGVIYYALMFPDQNSSKKTEIT